MVSALLVIFVVGLLLLGGAALLFGLSSRQTSAAMQRAVQRDDAQLRERIDVAGQRLLAADEAVRSAADELDFARAQFGLAQTKSYEQAISDARQALTQAFARHAEIDSAPSAQAKDAAVTEILTLVDRVMPPLLEQRRRFVDMRNAEADAAKQLDDVQLLVSESRSRIDAAQDELDALAIIYSAQALASIQNNPAQASALLDAAQVSCDRARALVDSDRALALRALNSARRSLAMADHQIDAVLRAGDQLRDAQERLTGAIASLTSDVADVASLQADPTAFAPLVADAQAAIDAGRAARNGDGDPLGALEALALAEEALDAALEPLRSGAQARGRAQEVAARRLSDAEAAVERARDHVTSRRGLIPLEGRSLLSSAEARLSSARMLLSSNPSAAIRDCDAAIDYATKVMNLPLDNPIFGPESFGRPTGFSFPHGGRPPMGGAGAGHLGAMIGGAVIGAVLSGGGARGLDFDFDDLGDFFDA